MARNASPPPGYTCSTMSANPSYEQSKQVAEASRETEWKQPSFGRELFLGNYQLDLIHPQPDNDPEIERRGEAFLRDLRTFLEERVDAIEIEREAKIPDDVVQGLKDLGALGMKIPQEYGGVGLSQGYHKRAPALGVRGAGPVPGLHHPRAGAGGPGARRDLDAPVGPSVDRPPRAAAHVRLRGA